MTTVTFAARGIPVPQGALVRSPTGGLYNRGGTRLAVWRSAVRDQATIAMGDRPPFAGPVRVALSVRFPRLKSHLRRDGTPRPGAPSFVATVPDIDKVARSCLDALSGVVFGDDRQVVELYVRKVYGPVPGVAVEVEELEP